MVSSPGGGTTPTGRKAKMIKGLKEIANAVGDLAAALLGLAAGMFLKGLALILWMGTRMPLLGSVIQQCWYYTTQTSTIVMWYWFGGATFGLLLEALAKPLAQLGATKKWGESLGLYRPGAHEEWHPLETSSISTIGWICFDVTVAVIRGNPIIAALAALAAFFIWRRWRRRRGGSLRRRP